MRNAASAFERAYEEDFSDFGDKKKDIDFERIEEESVQLTESDTSPGDITFYAQNIKSVAELLPKIKQSKSIKRLTVSHCNSLTSVEGLDKLPNLEYLDLSLNQVESFSKSHGLVKLVYLNLNCNSLKEVPYLKAFTKLKAINLSHNRISDLSPFAELAKKSNNVLSEINLDDNLVCDIAEVMKLDKLKQLKTLRLRNQDRNTDNPICDKPGYEKLILQALPGLTTLDGKATILIQKQLAKDNRDVGEYARDSEVKQVKTVNYESVPSVKIPVESDKDKLISQLYNQLRLTKPSKSKKCSKCSDWKSQLKYYEEIVQKLETENTHQVRLKGLVT